MRIGLICPSNMLYMPYVTVYENILKEYKINYEIINWDRFHIEESINTYRDAKIGHQRNFFDYCKYKRYILNKMAVAKYDKVVVFSLQLVYFLQGFLLNYYQGKYILDIRDHSKIIYFLNMKRVINKSMFTVVSSPGFGKWLPDSNKIIVNHNTQINSLKELKRSTISFNDFRKIKVSFIGSIRDIKINVELIKSLKNLSKFELLYYGANDYFIKFCDLKTIQNVKINERYLKKDEEVLYQQSDLINVLRYDDSINNITALPNRLYNAVVYGKPLLAFNGSILSEIIENYNLGLVINNFDNLDQKILTYLNTFNFATYDLGRRDFMKNVITDNYIFKSRLLDFFLKV